MRSDSLLCSCLPFGYSCE
uniref:Uncharacterized protein n=1 Tax=Anguilla anguilla TaxID=7936 RepID=A0A0E9QZS6_ANGAN